MSKPSRIELLCEQAVELWGQSHGASIADAAARDVICELADIVKTLAYIVKEQAAKIASMSPQ